MTASGPFHVLFLCTGNSARSILGECIFNSVGAERFNGYSAGSDPKGEARPYTLDLLRKLNYPTKSLRSKNWDEFARQDAPKLDFIFTVCDNAAHEVCPVWPGHPMTADWGLPDPAAATGSEAKRRFAFADTHRLLHNHISIFVNLPLESLDRFSLQTRLDDMGKTIPESA